MYRRVSGTLQEIKTVLEHYAQALSAKAKPTFLELCYKKELGVNVQDYFADVITQLPTTVCVVNWKIMEQKSAYSEYHDGFEAVEIKNLDDAEIFTQLILTKEKLTPDSAEAKAALETYLPLFLKASADF